MTDPIGILIVTVLIICFMFSFVSWQAAKAKYECHIDHDSEKFMHQAAYLTGKRAAYEELKRKRNSKGQFIRARKSQEERVSA